MLTVRLKNNRRNGIIEMIVLVFVLIVLFKMYLAWRAFNLVEEQIRKQGENAPVAEQTEKESELETLNREKQRIESRIKELETEQTDTSEEFDP